MSSKHEVLKIAEAYVLEHKPSFTKGTTKKEIQVAVQKVAKALYSLHAAKS